MVKGRADLLGTEIKMVAYGKHSERAAEAAFDECERIEKAYSRFFHNNELDRINSGEWIEPSEELYNLIRFGYDLGVKVGGVFDITIGGVLESWGYDQDYSFKDKGTVVLGKLEFGVGRLVRVVGKVDIGAFGRGYAVDRMANVLDDFGLENFCINAGGDIFARGLDLENKDAEDSSWYVLVEHPSRDNDFIGFCKMDSLALSCSKAERHRWKNKHYLVNPLSLKLANEMLAVYTQAPSTMVADGYATALFVWGFKEACSMVQQLPVEAMLFSPQGEVWKSEGFMCEFFEE